MTPEEQLLEQVARPALGFNDAEGVYCGLCAWRFMTPHMEVMEATLRAHLGCVHQRPLLYRVDKENGKRTVIP